MKRPFNTSSRLEIEEPPLRVEIHNTYTGEFLWSHRDGASMTMIPNKREGAPILQQKTIEILEEALAKAKAELEQMESEED
jgi:hypothetical protein